MSVAINSAPSKPQRIAEPIRVLHLLDTDGFAGTERHVLELMQALQLLGGVEPMLACRSGTPLHRRAEQLGLTAFGLPSSFRPTRLGRGVLAVRKLAKDRRIDLLHAHNGRTALTATMVNAWIGVFAVATQHFIDPQFISYRGPKKRAAIMGHNWVNSRLERVICVSHAARNAMLARERIETNKICTVHNGITAVGACDSEDTARFRVELCPDGGDFLIICVSRLSSEKGLGHLVDAIGLLRKRHPRIKLAIIGDGPDWNSLEQRIADLGLRGTVKLLGFRTDATTLIDAADIFVLPSPAEPFGLVILEAMSLGKPIIACNAGGPAEILTDGIDGMLVKPSDPTALAGAIGSLLFDAAFRNRLGPAARATFLARFQSSQMAERTLAIYRSAVGVSTLHRGEDGAVTASATWGRIPDQSDGRMRTQP